MKERNYEMKEIIFFLIPPKTEKKQKEVVKKKENGKKRHGKKKSQGGVKLKLAFAGRRQGHPLHHWAIPAFTVKLYSMDM